MLVREIAEDASQQFQKSGVAGIDYALCEDRDALAIDYVRKRAESGRNLCDKFFNSESFTCIYGIVNMHSGKFYVGSADDFSRRMQSHRRHLRLGIHPCKHLLNAYGKRGEASFSVVVFERCSRDELIAREQIWIDSLRAVDLGYNKRRVATSNLGVRPVGQALVNMSLAQKRRWENATPEQRKEHAARLKPTSKPYRLYSPDGILHEGVNLRSFAKSKGLCPTLLGHVNRGKRRVHRGWSSIWPPPPPPSKTRLVKFRLWHRDHGWVDGTGLKPFCEKMGLAQPAMHMVFSGKKPCYLGWKIDPSAPEKKLAWMTRCKITHKAKSPTGEIHEFRNISAFCRQHGLWQSALTRVLNGKSPKHKGWSIC